MSSIQAETPGSAVAAAVSIGAGRLLGGRREARAADGHDLLRVGRLHGLHGVAGVDRPLEGVGADDRGDLGDHHDVEERRQPRGDVLARGGAGEDDVLVGAGEARHEVGQRLGEAVAVGLALDVDHASNAVELRGSLGDAGAVLSRHEDVDVAAHRPGGGDRLRGGLVQARIVVLGQDQDGHQITPASVFSFAISSSTEPTFTPALRVAGSVVFSTLSRGVTSTP